jgi:hypothetical protein
LEGPQYAVVSTNDEYRIRAATVLEVVTRFGDVVDRARDLPYLRPHPLELELRKRLGVIAFDRHQGGTYRRCADRILSVDVGRVAECGVGLWRLRHDSPLS